MSLLVRRPDSGGLKCNLKFRGKRQMNYLFWALQAQGSSEVIFICFLQMGCLSCNRVASKIYYQYILLYPLPEKVMEDFYGVFFFYERKILILSL